jgi:hypothetical protein
MKRTFEESDDEESESDLLLETNRNNSNTNNESRFINRRLKAKTKMSCRSLCG